MAILITERLTKVPQDTYQSPAMLNGIQTEPEARAAYEFMTDAEVKPVGLFLHLSLKGTHASPDGIVGSDGLLEVKCPQPAAHLATLLGEPIPDRYIKQMQWQMLCAGRNWCDFVSYSPVFPEDMKLFVKRVVRDGKMLNELENDVRSFLLELEDKLAALQSRYQREEAA